MTERKEKTMLKWLKQKPAHGHGGLPIEKITDDPLATIQVHPHAKKSKNKANEIYAVSRVNPLFEEEDGKEVFSPSGNSGSSGYDSGSGPSDDDFPVIHNVAADLTDFQVNLLGRLSGQPDSPLIAAAAATTTSPSAKHPQLFINTENDVIHHETAILGPNGRPILQILEQNPTFVKSIALSIAANNSWKRPLSPISESYQQHQIPAIPPPPPLLIPDQQHPAHSPAHTKVIHAPQSKYNLGTSGSLYNKDAKTTLASTASNKNSNYTTIDSIGSAKLVKKDPQYVRSIRIGGPTQFASPSGANKRSTTEAIKRPTTSSNIPVSRRPSVTFADDLSTPASRPNSRKPSVEQDSIVTESLLLMTSVGEDDPPRLKPVSVTPSSSGASSRKASASSVSSTQSKGNDESGSTTTETPSSEQETVDLEAFANSLRKSRPIKQPSSSAIAGNSNKSKSHGSSDELDETSSSSSNSNPSEGYESATPPNERRVSTLDRPTSPEAASPTPRVHVSRSHKSPFGGIADHYAAAKEIAKEIESAKASTKKNLVRDLLYRGNRNAATSTANVDTINAIKPAPTTGSGNRDTGYGTHNGKNTSRNGRSGTGSRQSTLAGDAKQPHPSNHLQVVVQQPPDQQIVLSGRTSSPIYIESPYGKTGTKASSTSGTSRRQHGVNSIYSSSSSSSGSQDAAVTLHDGISNDWELVRVQQVYVKAGSSSQDQSHIIQHQPKKKSGKDAGSSIAASSTNINDFNVRAVVHQGQDHASTVAGSSSGTANSRRHPSSSLTTAATPSTSKSASSTARGKAGKKVPSNDDGLAAGARPRIQIDDVDSGNSSDRGFTEVRLEIEGTKIDLSGENVSDHAIQVEDDSPHPENFPSKVMIVTGDSQNIVVDLSGVPLDLKNAIVSGTALITLPDGLDTMLQPGYTMITIPATNTARPMSPKSPAHSQLVVDGGGGSTLGGSPSGASPHRKTLGKDGVVKLAMGQDDDKPLVTKGSSSGSGSDDECKLFSTKNKTQIWDVIQQTVGKQDTIGSKGKKKITTVFPFHPNQDSYKESPDFTIEGHRLDRQRKKVENEKRRRCACRLFGMLFFLLAFLGVLVALSMIYTKGQRYFGSV